MKTIKKLMSYLMILALVLLVSILPSVVNAVTATTIFSDGFEAPTNLGNWVEAGWNSSLSGHSGNKSAYLVGANNDQIISKVISTAGYENISLSFWFKAESLDNSTNNHDRVKLFYTVNGATWSEITSAQIDYSNDDNQWHSFSYSNFPITVNNNPNFAIKFEGNFNSVEGNDKAWIDDVSLTGVQMAENTLSLCTDSVDNDVDGQIDLADADCNIFKPKLVVTKVVVNDNSGTKIITDFPLFVDGNSVASGVQNVYSVGAHIVSETSDSNYTGTITGDCASNGSITLSVGDTKSCTITNDDNASTPINGGWTSWSPATCPTDPGSPASTLNRTCTNPSPANGGTDCEGSSVQECPAVPALPPQCTPNNEQVIVSDTTTMVGETPAVALTFIHPAWTANISGATWIWATDPVESLTDDADITKTFTKTFTISGNPTSGKLDIATDNSYTVKVNGTEVPVVFDQDNFQSTTQDSYDIKSLLVTGTNTIEISVTNWEVGQSADPAANPAGLLYKLTINSETCPEVPTTATINAKKIVCDSESDLPNWGAGDSTMQEITSNTANRYLRIHPNCHLADWTFEYAPDGTNNPGDNVGAAGGAWTPFSGTVSIPASSKVWVREQANPDYIPFSGDTSSEGGWDALSAEMYCSKDTLNYDNYDYIAPLEAGKTYNCVAFNVLKKAPEPTTTSVKMCKFDDKQNPLSGWTLMLKGEKVQEGLSVPTNISTGINSDLLSAGTSYLALSSGTWTNQSGVNSVDTEYSTTDSWLTHMDGYTGYQSDILELQINNQFDPNSNWGTYNSAHKYAQSFIPSTTGPANFRIFDGTGTIQNEGWFGDNNGNLSVDIYKGYAGITGEDGCVVFTDVPHGSYIADELSQDNWSNTSGLGDVSVNADTNTINIVNHDNILSDENPPEEETDVCSNIPGAQTTIPEDKELKDGLCVDIDNHEDNTPNPERISLPGGNGPINYGFVVPGGTGEGQVLGASIYKDDSSFSCTSYITTYMRMGKKNNANEVKKLQIFLNEYLGLNLPITGFFGLSTKNAVEQFQIKENTDVLSPWVKAGLYDNDKKPTGYVYKTTLRKINLIKCNTLDIPIPQLP